MPSKHVTALEALAQIADQGGAVTITVERGKYVVAYSPSTDPGVQFYTARHNSFLMAISDLWDLVFDRENSE